MQQEKSVPALRFPEFDNKLSKDILKNLTDVLRCGIASTPTYVEEGVAFLSSQNVTSSGNMSMENYNFVSRDYYENLSKHKLLKGDILYTRVGAGYGNAAIFPYEGDYGVYVSLTHIRCSNKLKNPFLKYYLNAPVGKRQAQRGVFQGGGVPNLNVKIVEKFQIQFPQLEEQQKIAVFLGAVDEKIAQLQKKKDLLEDYKKGCMQKLFSQEICFTDDNGNPFSDWEQHEIDKVFKHNKGYGLSKGAIVKDGQYPCVLYGELYTAYEEKIKNVQSYTNEDDGKESQEDDLLVPSSTTTSGIDLANVTVLPHEGVRLGGDITIMRPKKPINALFYAYYLTNFKKHEIARYAQGITIVHLYFNHFKKIKIDYPHPDEQKKIADFLSTIDNKIALVAKELDKAKTFKKGLLQQMFV